MTRYKSVREKAEGADFDNPVVQEFHDLFYDTCQFVGWLDKPIQKNPCDLWAYQEIICDTKPDLLIETGTQTGGSAFYFATIMDLVGHGQVATIDIRGEDMWLDRPEHERLTYYEGSSTDPETLEWLDVQPDERVMVSLDSDHSYEHVLQELELYGPLVTSGCYMVVEDTNVSGAHQAVTEYLEKHPRVWDVDLERERYLLTFHPGGWLRRR